MGFVQTIIDQAASHQGKDFTKLMPWSYSCDVVATHAQSKGYFIENSKIRKTPNLAKPGDIFLLESNTGSNDWIHTGIITAITGDLFETIEGNTNTDGSHNGNGVYKRTRNFRKAELDVLSIESLV